MNPDALFDAHALSEDETCVHVLGPYLHALGVGPDRLRVQKTFHLHLGRQMIVYNSDESRRDVGGRLDYLVANETGRPLFVIEVKRPGEALTDDDRDQGISYARLLDDIAPFVLLTNGETLHLYDTVTKRELDAESFHTQSAFFRDGFRLATAEDQELRLEALEHFLGYSEANLRAFSRAQTRQRMLALRADRPEPGKRYVPDLYVERGDARRAVDDFMRSPSVLFALGGESGTGKTNEVCALAEHLGESHLVIFFNGTELHQPLANTIADEFNWRFSEQLPLPIVCQRLRRLTARAMCRFVLVLDAVDEVEVSTIEQQLSDLAIQFGNFDGALKIIVSCKPLEWDRFCRLRGAPAPLASTLYTVPGASNNMSAVLGRFVETELATAISRYSAAFRLGTALSPQVTTSASDPLFMRLFCEVYEGRTDLPQDLDEPEVLSRYVAYQLDRTADPARARLELKAVGKALLHSVGQPANHDEGRPGLRALSVSESEVQRHAGLSAVEPVSRDLFTFGLLTRLADDLGAVRVAFTYDRVRDYVLTRLVLRLEACKPPQFEGHLDSLLRSTVGRNALAWHLERSGLGTQFQLFETYAVARISRFVQTYASLRSCLSSRVLSHVEPHSDLPVGAVFGLHVSVASGISVSLAIRPVKAGERLVEFDREFPANCLNAGSPLNVRWSVRTIEFGAQPRALSTPELEAARWMLRELREAVEGGGLDDSASSYLLKEVCTALITHLRTQLGLAARRSVYSYADQLLGLTVLPVDLNNVRTALNKRFAIHAQERTWVSRKAAQATPGPTGHVAVTIGPFERRQIEALAAEAVARGERFEPPRYVGGDPFGALHDVLCALTPAVTELADALLPTPNRAPPPTEDPFLDYSDERLREYVQSFFMRVIESYEIVARESLGRLASGLKHYSQLPLYVVATLRRTEHHPGQMPGDAHHLVFSFGHAENGENWVDVSIHTGQHPIERTAHGWVMTTGRGPMLLRRFTISSLMGCLRPANDRALSYGRGRTGAERYAPVRGAVYELVAQDLHDLTPEGLLAAAGIDYALDEVAGPAMS